MRKEEDTATKPTAEKQDCETKIEEYRSLARTCDSEAPDISRKTETADDAADTSTTTKPDPLSPNLYSQLMTCHQPEPMPLPIPLNRAIRLSGAPGAFAICNPFFRHSQEQTSSPNPQLELPPTLFEGPSVPEDVHVSATLAEDSHETTRVPSAAGNTEIFYGTVMAEESNAISNTVKWLAIILIFAVCLVLATVVPLLVSNKPTNNNDRTYSQPESTSTALTKPPSHRPFQENLPVAVRDPIQNQVGGPFWKANHWLLADPHFQDYSPERQRQRFYLALTYFSTNGDTWFHKDHWLSYDVSECMWFSSSSFDVESKYYLDHVCDENNTVINLSLSNNNLTGELLLYYTDFLPTLKVWDLGYNRIEGAFPGMMSTPYLEVFVLAYNLFGGIYSLEAGAYFDSLKVIRHEWTKIKGNNKGTINYILPKLEVFNMTGNPSDGEVWSSLGVLSKLEYLSYGHRGLLHGNIPSELGQLSLLKEVNLANLTKLGGPIPSELGLLTALTKLDLKGTPVTGTVPVELCHRASQGVLELAIDCDGDVLECCNF